MKDAIYLVSLLGEAKFEGIDDDKDSKLTVQFQNENLVAIRDGKIICSVPDLISILDVETGQPITTEHLKYGYRAVVIGMPCNEKWRNTEALKLVEPRYFKYDIDYIPIEKRVSTGD